MFCRPVYCVSWDLFYAWSAIFIFGLIEVMITHLLLFDHIHLFSPISSAAVLSEQLTIA